MRTLRVIVSACAAAVLAAGAVVPAQAAPKSTAISLTSPAATIRQGAKLAFGGLLKSGTKGVKAAAVTISFRRKGTTAFVTAATVKTNAAGRFTWASTAKTTGVWKVSYRGSSAYRAAAASKTITVTALRPRLLGGVSGKGVVIDDGIEPYVHLGSETFGYPYTYPAPGRDYTVVWSYACSNTVPDNWMLYWLDHSKSPSIEIAVVSGEAAASGTFAGHDGDPDLTDNDYWTRWLSIDITGKNLGSCSSTAKVYSGTAVVPV
ncbi:hypothetical protein [Actinoplanes utahensis]|uniref:hypothetical protein n=1 Tax=Actinoplanes utahensis TaxID=1869 RepID=UPI00126A341D|nr:hypothetical protein [Actinoplanes utahensis]